MSSVHSPSTATPSNFLRQIIENDLAQGTYAQRRWAGTPGDAAHHAAGQPDPAKIRTRFPPEPNGYLHVGHAKSICLNFGLARDYDGVCHLRFDDTNPEKEDTEFVHSIIDAVRWLGFDWAQVGQAPGSAAPYQASDYFDFMYRAAEHLIEAGHAYVDEQTAEDMRLNRGDFTTPGKNSPYRDRSPADNLARFREMRDGQHADGDMVLRAKIDMASPNINLRDPAIYRIRHAEHHHTGNRWCVYPMYTFAHPIEDALEQITHSICTLEFEDQRPFYDWLMARLIEGGLLASPPPKQYEFARLNLTYVVTSKRKLAQLVNEKRVSGWDDPRMPTLVAARRRGYTPEGFRLFAERIGVAKGDSWIDYATLEDCMREHLNEIAPRRVAVLDPLKLAIDNYPDGQSEECFAPNHPQKPELGKRAVPFSKELWIEREDFTEMPPKGYFRIFPGNKVRLRYGFVIECTRYDAATDTVHCTYDADTKSGTPGSDKVKVKGNIHWVSAQHSYAAEVRLYDRLFSHEAPGTGDADFLTQINPHSLDVLTHAKLEPSLDGQPAGARFQFERLGYFCADPDGKPGAPVFNRTVSLKDGWAKAAQSE